MEQTVKEDIIIDFDGTKKVFKWILDEFHDNHHIVTLTELYERYGFGAGQILMWCMTVKFSWVFRGLDGTIIPKTSYEQILDIYEDSDECDRPSIYNSLAGSSKDEDPR